MVPKIDHFLILSAIVVGNAAYEAGNISGAVLGMETLFGSSEVDFGIMTVKFYSLILGGIAFMLLYTGNYRIIERSLIILVITMSLSFLIGYPH